MDGNDADLPNVHPICSSETDDLGAWLVLDEVVHFAVGNEIFVRGILREVRKLQVMEISRICILGVFLIPKVLEDESIGSRQSKAAAQLLRLLGQWLADGGLSHMLRHGAISEVVVLACC